MPGVDIEPSCATCASSKSPRSQGRCRLQGHASGHPRWRGPCRAGRTGTRRRAVEGDLRQPGSSQDHRCRENRPARSVTTDPELSDCDAGRSSAGSEKCDPQGASRGDRQGGAAILPRRGLRRGLRLGLRCAVRHGTHPGARPYQAERLSSPVPPADNPTFSRMLA